MRFAVMLFALAACYGPPPDPTCALTCEDDSGCPNDYRCSSGRCAAPGSVCDGDAGVVGDAAKESCIGQASGMLVATCLTPSTRDRVFTGRTGIDTTGDPACDPTRMDACFVTAGRIVVDTLTVLEVKGSRPLVLWAAESIEVLGNVDASTKTTGPDAKTGPGANPSACTDFGSGASIGVPAVSPGGAGGSNRSVGGPGGMAISNSGTIANGATGVALPKAFQGGCAGGTSGSIDFGRAFGGDGGGAVYLMAGVSIVVSGTIHASGGGGLGGVTNVNIHSGGGGGGSGGLVGLDAPTISIDGAKLVALGGGGGAGANDIAGGDGDEPRLIPMVAAGLPGNSAVDANDGGVGSSVGGSAGSGGGDAMLIPGGGGGGGGGAGDILLFGEVTGEKNATVAPPASVSVGPPT